MMNLEVRFFFGLFFGKTHQGDDDTLKEYYSIYSGRIEKMGSY